MEIKVIKAEETYPLRLAVLKISKNYIYKYKGDFNVDTVHFSTHVNNVIVGIISLMKTDNDLLKGSQIQLRGMAIDIAHQSKGIGSKLIEKSISFCEENSITMIWCNARENAVDFYKNHGFETIGDKFFIEHVCFHYLMYKKI